MSETIPRTNLTSDSPGHSFRAILYFSSKKRYSYLSFDSIGLYRYMITSSSGNGARDGDGDDRKERDSIWLGV